MEVFVRRDRETATECAAIAGGDGAAVARLWAEEEWWREWWSGVMEAAVVVVIRSRRCFGGRVYSLGAWQPAATKTGIALRERRVRAHSVGSQSRAFEYIVPLY